MERRIAAILVGDMVGYSRLIELDEAYTLDRQRTHMLELIDPTIERMNGHIVKLTGDGVIAEFGSVVEAVQCAVAIQKEMAIREEDLPEDRRIQYRVAINLGDVVFENNDVFGDGVNIAARLEALAEPGGIVVSGTAFDLLKNHVDVGYLPLGEKQLKNIATPVRVYRVTEDVTPLQSPIREKRRVGFLVLVVMAISLFAGSTWFYWRNMTTGSFENAVSLPEDTLSIVVLPLDNLSSDPAQDYFADGLTDDITTDLSRLPGLLVIARNSAFAYAEKTVDPQVVAEELGVRFVLEGSVRRVGETLRINVQLIEGQTGSYVWAERYDGSPEDVLIFQDSVVNSVVAALPLHITGEAGLSSLGETDNPKAFDAFLEGSAHFVRRTPEGFAAAAQHFKRAVELDPDYSRAYAALASTYWQAWKYGWHEALGFDYSERRFCRKEAEMLLKHALRNPTGLAYQVAAEVRRQEGNHEEMLQAAKKAVEFEPGDPNGLVILAFALNMDGQGEAALRSVNRAMELEPMYPAYFLYVKGLTLFNLKLYEEAVEYLSRALERNPTDENPLYWLAASYAQLGRLEEADKSRRANKRPLTIDAMKLYVRFKNPEDWEHFAEGLRLAGFQ